MFNNISLVTSILKYNCKLYKYINMKKIMKQQDIPIFYGDSEDYFDKLYNWIIS